MHLFLLASQAMPTIEQARLWYPQKDPVHGFDHVLRVYRMAEHLAILENADVEIVRAAALLHDTAGDPVTPNPKAAFKMGSIPNERSTHHLSSADFARQVLRSEDWSDERIAAVVHCIRAHRFRDDSQEPQTREAQVLYDADKLDAIGAIGVARAIAYALRAGQPVFAQPSERFLSTGKGEPGEAHSAYHEYVFKLRHLMSRLHTPSAREIAERRHALMQEYFEQLEAEMRGEP
jgi:uncharacterized protein